ncbi:hypothetical protein NFI96_001886 [Prochilodus magdalenae]|nr:hypothetical protein NFI96_001886 [Prochilodus magdalenae]
MYSRFLVRNRRLGSSCTGRYSERLVHKNKRNIKTFLFIQPYCSYGAASGVPLSKPCFKGVAMPYLLSLVQAILLSALLFQYTATFPAVGRSRRSELQIRQLGDLEFTNRYAELLKSKAKLSSLCSFLRRMQNSKKSANEYVDLNPR